MSINKITQPIEALQQSTLQNQKLLSDASEELRIAWRRLQGDYLGQGAEEADMQYQILAKQIVIFQQELERLVQFCSSELEVVKERSKINAT